MLVVFSCMFPLKCSFKSGESGEPLYLPVPPATPSTCLRASRVAALPGSLSHWLRFHVTFMLIFPKVHFQKVFRYVL